MLAPAEQQLRLHKLTSVATMSLNFNWSVACLKRNTGVYGDIKG